MGAHAGSGASKAEASTSGAAREVVAATAAAVGSARALTALVMPSTTMFPSLRDRHCIQQG